MIHAKSAAPQAWFPEDDETLAGCDHFLDVMEVEPTQQKRLAQRVGIDLVQSSFKDFLPTPEPKKPSFGYFTTKTNCDIALFSRKLVERPTIFVSSRKMAYEIGNCFNAESAQRQLFGSRNPVKLTEFLRGVDHAIGPDARSASI
jgi:hypothetical protein